MAGMNLDRLRFHLAGDTSVVFNLYEMLSSRCVEIQLRDPADRSRVISLGRENLRMVGLEPEECVLPSDRRSQSGHVLLQEYFSLPEKFLFLGGRLSDDVKGHVWAVPLCDYPNAPGTRLIELLSALAVGRG